MGQALTTERHDNIGRILPFSRKTFSPERADLIAAVLMALEESPSFPPVVMAAKGIDGTHYVGASIAARAFRLTADEARLTADCLWADPGVPGFADVAARFRDAADASDRAFLRSGS